jgi:anti-sigma regulatory factor (Ser/Thr protein kinase)
VLASKRHSVSLKNDLSEIELLATTIDSFCQQSGLSSKITHDTHLVLEEVVTNSISYGFDDDALHMIEVMLELNENELQIVVRDDGRPFNPLEAPPPDLSLPLEDREIGGLGIFLVRKFMDEVSYAREGSFNVLAMKKRIAG